MATATLLANVFLDNSRLLDYISAALSLSVWKLGPTDRGGGRAAKIPVSWTNTTDHANPAGSASTAEMNGRSAFCFGSKKNDF